MRVAFRIHHSGERRIEEEKVVLLFEGVFLSSRYPFKVLFYRLVADEKNPPLVTFPDGANIE